MKEQVMAAASAGETTADWRLERRQATLQEVFRTIAVPRANSGGPAKKMRTFTAFMGPGYLVAVGYMDPGNWATAIAGGSKFGYALLSVALISNFMAILLQSLCARLAIASGRDLAQACHDAYPRRAAVPLWLLAEVAIVATDIAEVLGTAIGINLLFGLSLEIGIVITTLDVFLVLMLQRLGFRYLEAFIVTLLAVIAGCFAIQIMLAKPDWAAAAHGLVPTSALWRNQEMLFLGLGIVGATVMPHNLYLHSSIALTRAFGASAADRRQALTYATIDSTAALMLAFLINAAILVLAAASFNNAGHTDVAELSDAHALLAPLLGSNLAPTLFGIALLCCGLNSTVTATMAGQIVMEGFVNIKIAPWARRLITRALAVIPAAIVAVWWGREATSQLLLASQVILAFQLPFAVLPLVHLTASRSKMGVLIAPRWLTALAAISALLIIVLGFIYLVSSLRG